VEYWNETAVVEPCGLTVAFNVAPVVEIEEAAPAVAVGAPDSIIRASIASQMACRMRVWLRVDRLKML
jgi:hypothetical protein